MHKESTMQLLELTTHGTQCKIHPCSAAILLQDLPSPKSALLVFTQQTQHQVEPCALGLVPSSLQHQPGGLVPHCPQCHSCPQCHPQPSSTLNHAYQKSPMLRGSCLAAAPCAGSGACQLCCGYQPLQNSWGFRKLKKENAKENDCFLRDH